MPSGTRTALSQIDKLVAQYEADVAALRRVRAMLNGHGADAGDVGAIVADAMTLDAERKRARQRVWAQEKRASRKRPLFPAAARVKAQRTKTAALLARYDATEPRRIKGAGAKMAVLLTHGYLRKVGDGYVRTEKPFTA